MLLTKEQINGASDIATRDVEVSQLGGTVRLRQLTVADLDATSSQEGLSTTKRTLLVLACSIIDEQGERVFSNEEVDQLAKRSPEAIKALSDAVADLNGWSKLEVATLEKN
jgi:hypothetical protein